VLTLTFQPPPSIIEEDAFIPQVRQVISDLEGLALRSPSGSSVDPEITRRANALRPKLQQLIEKSLGEDITNVDELLALNDTLTAILAPPRGALTSATPPISRRVSRDKGTGLTVNIPSRDEFVSSHTTPTASTLNGHPHQSPLAADDSDEELVSTPRLDKGKQRATEEPERPTPVLRRPSLVLDEEEGFLEPEVRPEVGVSPTVDR
jgi:protein phosphatase 1 regulatory subunit 37